MLEQAGLLLGAWTATTGAAPGALAVPARLVHDAATRRRLGVVRWRGGRPRNWVRWLGREALEVYETEDESLLCTVQTPWLLTWVWEVYDADGRRVAVVRGPEILDGFGRRLAVRHTAADGRGDRFLMADGVELGEVSVVGADTLLQFGATVADQPFAKMALLGAILCEG
jgi:hypothetical protein